MRKCIILPLLLTAITTFAQKANVQSAWDFLKLKDYPKAKQFIDEASVFESTANDPKMWYYRGKVYQALNDSSTFAKANPEAAYIATESFLNCIKTDKKEYYKDSTDLYTWIAGYSLYNRASEEYSAGNIQAALKFYTKVQEVFPYDKDNNLKRNNITPDIVTKNLYLCAYRLKDYPTAKIHLQKLIDSKFNDPSIYQYMGRILLEEGDTAKALSYVEIGRGIFEEHTGLISQEIAIYSAQGRTNELIDKVSSVIESDPENERLYTMRGTLYENTNNIDKAIADYKKAVELKDDYMAAFYYLGSAYYGQAVDLSKKLNTLDIKDPNSNKVKAELDQKLKDAQENLERAKELNPRKTEEDKKMYLDTVTWLKGLYANTGQMEKSNEMKSELEKL